MAKDNIYWCDDCGCAAKPLDDVIDFGTDYPVHRTSWCPNCGRLEDESGTITPHNTRRVAMRIGKLAVEALQTDGAHHKQHYLECILDLAVGDDEAAERFHDVGGWERGVPA